MQRRVTVAEDAAAAMFAAARAAWPREMVGVAGGREAGDRAAVAAFLPLPAAAAPGAFVVDAAAFATAEAALRARGLALLGFVHSHPQASPHPSRADCAAAWPDTLQLLLGGATPATLALRAFTIRCGVAHPLPLCLGEAAP